MASLASSGGLNDADCYRLLTRVMYALQCGPTNGSGSLAIPVENLPPDKPDNYRAGYVALITDQDGTPTDQLFIAYRDFSLPPRFPVWGEVVQGLDIVQAVAAAGVRPGGSDAGSEMVAGEPLQPISIESALVGS
jgi:peptidyl-prolyl cis-trans isomerase B (cyclophilin B)